MASTDIQGPYKRVFRIETVKLTQFTTNLSGLAALVVAAVIVDGAALPADRGLLLQLLLRRLPQDALDVRDEQEGEAREGAEHRDLHGVQHVEG